MSLLTSSKKSRKGFECKYHSYETFPARVFFEVRDTQNYQLMCPKPGVKTERLKEVFLAVYDTYFEKSDNPDAKTWLENRNTIAALEFKKAAIKSILHLLWTTPPDLWNHPEIKPLRDEQVKALNELLDDPITLEGNFTDEVERVLSIELGILENEIVMCRMQMESVEKQTGGVVFDYYQHIVALEGIHGRALDEKMMLPKFVEYEKAANKIIDKQNQRKWQAASS